MPIKKIVGWAIVIFLAYFLITKPHAAASDTHGLFSWLDDVGHSLTVFFNSL